MSNEVDVIDLIIPWNCWAFAKHLKTIRDTWEKTTSSFTFIACACILSLYILISSCKQAFISKNSQSVLLFIYTMIETPKTKYVPFSMQRKLSQTGLEWLKSTLKTISNLSLKNELLFIHFNMYLILFWSVFLLLTVFIYYCTYHHSKLDSFHIYWDLTLTALYTKNTFLYNCKILILNSVTMYYFM